MVYWCSGLRFLLFSLAVCLLLSGCQKSASMNAVPQNTSIVDEGMQPVDNKQNDQILVPNIEGPLEEKSINGMTAGNSIGNIMNTGIMAEKDGWYMYGRLNGMLKFKPDHPEEMTKITDDSAAYINREDEDRGPSRMGFEYFG